jgi:hypothetical protein
MLFMVIERFKDRDPAPIYARLREQDRALPEGLRYVDSWVEVNFDRCFQLMECDDTMLLQRWVLQWRDLVDFEIVPVSPSKKVRELVLPDGEARPDPKPDG